MTLTRGQQRTWPINGQRLTAEHEAVARRFCNEEAKARAKKEVNNC